MYRLLIVEDHKWTRQGLVETVDWAKARVEVVHQCANGLEAQSFLRENTADIILTDIKMDGMDGLELTRWIKGSGIDAEVILISAYHDFDYAIKAVNLGASAYVLKPIDEDDLLKKMEEAVRELDKRKKIISNLNEFKRQSAINILRDFIKNPKANADETINRLKEIDSSFNAESFSLFMIESMSESIEVSKLRYYVSKSWDEVYLFDIEEHCVGILPLNSSTDIYGIGKRIYGVFEEYTNINYRSSRGEAVKFSQLQSAYHKTLLYMNQCFLLGKDGFNSFEEKDIIKRKEYSIQLFDTEKLWKVITDEDTENLEGILNETRAECIKNNIDSKIIISEIQMLINEISVRMEAYAITLADVYKDMSKSFDDVNKKTLENLFGYLKNLIYVIIEMVSKQGASGIRPIVRKTIAKIRADYDKSSLSLKDIANLFSTNYTYLSKAFKEDTRMSFTKYLNNYRIQKAKDLLKHTDKKIYEISYDVGIEPGHFNYVFKKTTGVSPGRIQKVLGRLY